MHNNDEYYVMGAPDTAFSTVKAEAFPAQYLPVQDDLTDRLTPPEKAYIATIEYLLANGLPVDAAAKSFLEAAPTPRAARRRAHALLRLAGPHLSAK
jgi:hypothetical protein